jgi:hypothetical protein
MQGRRDGDDSGPARPQAPEIPAIIPLRPFREIAGSASSAFSANLEMFGSYDRQPHMGRNPGACFYASFVCQIC